MRVLAREVGRVLGYVGVVPEEVFVGRERTFITAKGDTKFIGDSMFTADDSTIGFFDEHDFGVACKAKEDATMGLELASVGGRILSRHELERLARITLGASIEGFVGFGVTQDADLGAKGDDFAGGKGVFTTRKVLDGDAFGDRMKAVPLIVRRAAYCAAKHQ